MSTLPHPSTQPLKLALVHDFLIQMGGAERVVEVMAQNYPDSPIYTSATVGPNLFPGFKRDQIVNSWMQRIKGLNKIHKSLFFLYPFAFKSMQIAGNLDIVWISSSGFSKWIPKRKGATFICYCHTPPRFFWNPDQYLENEIPNQFLRGFVKRLIPAFRWSDKRQSEKIDIFVANSKNIQDRIRSCYGRESFVIYPPVDVNRFPLSKVSEDFFLIVSRLVSYKRVDLAVQAFTKANRKLVIIGDGPDRKRLESLAGDTITFLGRAPDNTVEEKMATCAGFVFPGLEDFGITPVEAQACGKPIIAFRGGGALETVIEGETGVFFDSPEADCLFQAITEFDSKNWNPSDIRKNAERFSTERFINETEALLNDVNSGNIKVKNTSEAGL